ncbi:hypothetical protein WV31_10960 [Magnetospirillum sp. ME-1]|uniref:site-specific integrase n=1 Tax=Magnetospirillum sp. ME-1 TaxID=1639348 RepID=UPI000A17D326|nr:site-specific integrase [Magnetospirillum sp. ME-1]ARJ66146.1 hypothetical protein WV31_10960 [Magnetospirillum sp. ME-1]
MTTDTTTKTARARADELAAVLRISPPETGVGDDDLLAWIDWWSEPAEAARGLSEGAIEHLASGGWWPPATARHVKEVPPDIVRRTLRPNFPAVVSHSPLDTELFGTLNLPSVIADDTAIVRIAERANRLARKSKADNTIRSYRSAWKQFALWCDRFGFEPLCGDPAVIALHLADASERLAPASVRLRLAAIVAAHRLVGLQLDSKHQAIASVLGGAIREKGSAPTRQAKPVRARVLERLVAACPDTAVGIRDRAMLLVGFGAATRRSELVELRINDVRIEERGVLVSIRRSKTDQEGEGVVVAIHGAEDPNTDVRAALAAWMDHRGRSSHARRDVPLTDDERRGDAHLFCALSKTGRPLGRKLSDVAVVRMIKEAALRAGIDPDGYSGHSLRSGLATSASANGASLAEIMDQGRWRSVDMAKRYVRDEEVWKNGASMTMARRSSAGTKDGHD